MTPSLRPPRPLRHWLPRLFVLGSAVAMALPTPGFVARLSRDERVLWWSEVLWVLAVPAVFAAAVLAAVRLGRGKGAGKRAGKPS